MPEMLRGFLIDSARCLEKRSYYRKLIVEAAARGSNAIIWHFTDDQGCTLKFDLAPEIAGPHAYSKEEMKGLVRFAKRHGVTLIPELESLGHSRYLTSHPKYQHLLETEEEFTAICPVSPETRKIVSALLHEVAEVFDGPYIHVGLDEVKLGGHPLTREALSRMTEREIFADYVKFLHGEVTALGRRMIIWGDHRTRTMGFLPMVPKDIVIADWEYSKEVAPDQVEYFLELGFDVLLCPALITYDQPFLSGTQLGLANVRSMSRHQTLTGTRGRIAGIVTTIWTPTRYMHEAQWLGVALAADLMRDAEMDLREGAREFLREFHGIVRVPEELCGALTKMIESAPLREPYLSLLKGREVDGGQAETLKEGLRGWREIAKTLGRHRLLVRKNRSAYGALGLAARFLAYLHRRAVERKRSSQEGRRFFQRLERQWDKERHEDDPRKVSTRFAFDRNEHLLLSFGDSLRQEVSQRPSGA